MRRLFTVLLLAFLTFGMPRVAEAQVTVAPFLTSNPQFLDGSGSPLNSGCVFTYAAGTTTPLVTYSDPAGSTPNSNPVLLNSGGFPQAGGIWLTAAAYKFVVKTAGGSNCSTGSTITTTDGITWSTPLSTFSSITSTGNAIIQPGTAATGGANQSSPTLCIQGFYFNVTSLTDQYCWQDVIGTGTNPTNTYTLTHSGSGGTSLVSIIPPFSAAAAKNIGNVQYAAQYTSGSTTCGIAEAYAALPSTGGEIVLQQGNCSAAGWPVTIQKPLLLVGQGMGGTTDAGTNAVVAAGSWLTNTSTGNSFFIITLPAVGNSTEGVTIRDLAMFGNKAVGGATAGDCVDINGGSGATQVRALSFENVHCNQPKGSGFVIKDNSFMINFRNVHVNQSGSHCYVIKDGVNAGVNSQIHFLQSTGDLCGGSNASFNPGTADGLNISGSTSREVDIDQSTFADSNNGINVVAGAVNVNLFVSHSDFETNTTCDISLNDGFGHKIMGNTLRGTGTGARGICTAMPVGAAASLSQLLLDGNNFNSHTVQDVTIGANQKTCFLLPQATNVYTYTDNSGHCVKLDVDSNGQIIVVAVGGINPSTNDTNSLGNASLGFSWGHVDRYVDRILELTAPSASSGQEVCYGDSTAHAMECSYNNSAFSPVVRNLDLLTPPPIGTTTPNSAKFTTITETNLLISNAAPTISAGFGTSPSIVNQNGTAAFAINVGTGGTANSGTIGLPTSTNGWVCFCEDQTTTSATVNRCKQTGGTASTAIIGNFNTTPVAAAWVASDILTVSCLAR